MASARLRKAFKYPADEDDSEPEDLDEEHQEKLIADLETEDTQKNELYRKAFLAIPLIGALVFIYSFIASPTARQRLISILGISSLACTAYILHFQPIEKPERKGKIPIYKLDAAKGPVERYLVWLNGGLAALLLLASGISYSKGNVEDTWRETLPMVIFGLSMFAREQLAPLDLEGLKRARFELKGA